MIKPPIDVKQEADSNLASAISTVTYSFNNYHQLTGESVALTDLGTYSLSYAYNYVGAPTSVTYTAGDWVKHANYDYNYAGTLKGVGTDLISGAFSTNNTNVVNTLTYRGFGAVKSLNFGANPRLLQLSYDAKRQQLTNLYVRRTSNSGIDNVIVNSSYDYYNGGNNNGRIQKITDSLDAAYTTTYGYDAYYRLTSATASAYTRSYGYDNWGNLTSVSATGASETGSYSLSYATNGFGAPAINRINTIVEGTSYSVGYDAAGNLTSDNNTGATYTYDGASRLKMASQAASSYEYDGDGRRVKQATSSSTTFYLWSSVLGQPVVELGSGGGITRAYVYSSSGQRVALYTSNSFYRVHGDHLSSSHKLTDTSGNVSYSAEYDPHGNVRQETGTLTLTTRKFTGYERDGANLDFANARAYAYKRGRFLQVDPLGLGASGLCIKP